ncbi:hypothetical protein [Aquimarina atlantica]|nr:hypothetical protein [Aquimarina atlantica]
MKYNLASILQQLSAVYFEEIEGNFTIQELWEWMLFDNENSFLNEQLQIHQPSGVPINKRSIELNKELTITGNYCCFTYIDHQPSYHLQKVKSPDELASLILAKSGITNSFTTVMMPIVKGKPIPMVRMKNFTATEIDLINQIQQIISCSNNSNFNELVEQGRISLIHYKNKGISQQNMYDTIHFIARIYQALNLEYKSDIADEFLDYISGYIGNKKRWIWDNRL